LSGLFSNRQQGDKATGGTRIAVSLGVSQATAVALIATITTHRRQLLFGRLDVCD
jgi:hypothetical protein